MSRFLLAATIASLLLCSIAIGDDLPQRQLNQRQLNQAPLKKGDAIGAFYVTKVAGADEDGVEPGDSLCYRCRYGSSPMVIVFARHSGTRLTQLVKELNAAVVANEEGKLRGLVTLMGEDMAVLKDVGEKIAATAGAKRVPVVIADDIQTGPLNYRLPSDVEVTIVVAKDSQVVSTYNFAEAQIDLAAVMGELKHLLN